MAASFTDCCIRYGQEFVYTTFSEGNMTLGEIYMSLAYGLIDPTCLPAMAIIHYDNKIWCTDTRRLKLAKELEKRGRFDVLELMHVREVKTNTAQYRDFVHHRLPAMQRRGLDGSAIKVSDRRGPACCFNSENRFRIDLEEHIIQDHLNNFTLELFKNLTIYYCHMCQPTTRITCTKSSNRSYYTIIRKCGCKPNKPHQFTQPWSKLTFVEMCNELLRYNSSVKRKVITQNSTGQPKNTSIVYRSIATQTHATDIPSTDVVASQNTIETTVLPLSSKSAVELQPNTFSEHNKLINYSQNQHHLTISTINHESKQKETNNLTSRIPSDVLRTTKEYQTKRNIYNAETCKDSPELPRYHKKTMKHVGIRHHRVHKSCCNVS